MPLRIVVSFRGTAPGGDDKRYLERALGLKKRAEAHGAKLCAWGALAFAFDFDPDELEEAASLASIGQDAAPAGERFGAALAEGEMTALGEGGAMSQLGWGEPLVRATLLARDARAGEVLLDPDLLARREAEIDVLGFRVATDRGHHVLLTAEGTPAPVSLPRPPVLGAPSLSAATPIAPASIADPAPSGPRLRAPSPPAIPPPPPPRAPFPSGPISTPISAEPPVSIQTRSSVIPDAPDGAEPLAELARQALLQGDLTALESFLSKLRVTGEHSELVERMAGLVALRRGATGEALRRLRDAAESVKEPAQQARARLAYGVALASAGRMEGALLEALEALARAREAGDAHGERACALFMARLSASAGHPAAASAWAVVAKG
jgi:hypothetical protein